MNNQGDGRMERREKGNSKVSFPSEYVCIDVETTGLSYDFDEIIEIAAAIVENGQVSKVFTTLVKPKRSHAFLSFDYIQKLGFNSFEEVDKETYDRFFETHLIPQFIVDLTGITNEMLMNAPSPEEVLDSLYEVIGNRAIVGHNVNFDINFLYDALQSINHTLSNDYIDTMRIARKLFPELKHHRLIDIVQHLGIVEDTHHRAERDVVATIQCFEKMRQIVCESMGIPEFVESFTRSNRHYNYRKDLLSEIVPFSGEIDETNPVFGKVVVFTGALSRMSRKEALQIVSDYGGIPADSITKKTNYLVVGNEEFVSSVKDGKTAKMKKVEEYQSKGLDIIMIPEDTFFELIEQ